MRLIVPHPVVILTPDAKSPFAQFKIISLRMFSRKRVIDIAQSNNFSIATRAYQSGSYQREQYTADF